MLDNISGKWQKTGMDIERSIQKNYFELLLKTQEKMRKILRGAEAGLSPVEVLIIRVLVEKGPVPQHVLGEVLSKDKSQIARLVKGLEAKGLIKRQQSKEDGRVYIVSALLHVNEKIERIAAYEHALIGDMLAGVPKDDLAVFERVLKQINAKL